MDKIKKEGNQGNRLGLNLNYKEGERELTISIKKAEGKPRTSSISLPVQWIKELEIEDKPKNVKAKCEDGKIILWKNK